jgi:hypothetical protein
MMLGEREFVDDEALNLTEFMKAMKVCTGKVGSASPSPYLYACAMEEKDCSFVVTLSSQLSGSYSNAMIGKSMAEENKGCMPMKKVLSWHSDLRIRQIKVHAKVGWDLPLLSIFIEAHGSKSTMQIESRGGNGFTHVVHDLLSRAYEKNNLPQQVELFFSF